MDNLAARILAALADADILAVHHGQGVLSCGDTAADHPSAEAAYGEVMAVVSEDLDTVAVSVVWRDEDGDIVDADDGADFNPDDLAGIVAEVCRLRFDVEANPDEEPREAGWWDNEDEGPPPRFPRFGGAS